MSAKFAWECDSFFVKAGHMVQTNSRFFKLISDRTARTVFSSILAFRAIRSLKSLKKKNNIEFDWTV